MNQISVGGTGSAAAPPDVALIDVGVDVVARSVAEARSMAATDSTQIMEALRSHGVASPDLVTTAMSIRPEYDHREGRRLRGYRVANSVEAKVRDIEAVGKVIDAVAAVGDTIVINGIHFTHADPTVLERRAREAAWEDASRKAAELAVLSGVTLGPVIAITEHSHGAPPTPVRAMAREAAGVVTPIAGGELAVSVTIDVQFSI